ncbi:MAG: hypothetical protein JW829_17075 [Pirellulales bacterium]|nr:hypothetical protein [Pirellulales bacterium]
MPIHVSQLLEPPQVPLTFRIRDERQHISVAHLTSAKCTIGSAPTCTLHLTGQDIRPVHCLILRGRRETVVRRWAPDTLLNGKTYEDALLAAGDRLHIGPVELEVLNSEATAEEENTLLESILDLKKQCQNLELQLEGQRTTGLQQFQAFERERSTWIHAEAKQRIEYEKNIYLLRELLNQRDSQIGQLTSRLEQLKKELSHVRNDNKPVHQNQTDELDRLRSESARLRESLAIAESREKEREAAIVEREKKLETQRLALEQLRAALEEERAMWDARQNSPTADEETDQEASTFQPISFMDQYAGMLDQDKEPDPDDPTPADHESMASESKLLLDAIQNGSDPDNGPTKIDGKSANESEESLEQYMSQLMRRIRGETELPNGVEPPDFAQEPPADPGVACDPPAPPAEEPTGRIHLEDIKRANVLPEHRGNFEALRQLANITAHQAIGTHANRMKRHRLCSKLLVSAVGFTGGLMLLYLSPHWKDSLAWYGVASLAAGIFWAGQSAAMLLKAIRQGSLDEPPLQAEPASHPEIDTRD